MPFGLPSLTVRALYHRRDLIKAMMLNTLSGVLLDLCFKPGFYIRPLGFDDAEADGVAVTTAGHDHMVAQDAFLLRS